MGTRQDAGARAAPDVDQDTAADDALLASMWKRSGVMAPLYPRSVAELIARRMTLMEWLCDRTALGMAPRLPEGQGQHLVVTPTARVWIGRGAFIGAHCLFRDEVVIGAGAIVGSYSDIARSVIGEGARVHHRSNVFDSVIGEGAEIAMTMVGNNRWDGGPIRLPGGSMVSAHSVGLMMGDRSYLGAMTLTCPGAMIEPGVSVPSMSVVMGRVDHERAQQLKEKFMEEWR